MLRAFEPGMLDLQQQGYQSRGERDDRARREDRVSRIETIFMALVLAICMALLAGGCAPTISPAEQKMHQQDVDALQQQKDQEAKALDTLNATLKANAAKGKGSPVSNPIDATNYTVSELHGPLYYGSIVSFIVAVLALGLSAIGPTAATIPWLSWLGPVGQIAQVIEPCAVRTFCLTFAALMLLPFIRVSAICAGLSIGALFIYEMVINKGNLQTVLASMGKILTGVGGTVAITKVATAGAIK
jgi:hypothetical protein